MFNITPANPTPPPPPPGPGTFSYTFNYIGAGGVVDASDPAKMPFLTTDGALVLNTVTCSPSGLLPDGTSVPVPVTVTVTFTFTDNDVTNDGLAFISFNATPPKLTGNFYNASTTGLTITQFGAIPLSRSGDQFRNLNDLTFVVPSGDAPTILLNTDMSACFFVNSNFNSDIANWNTSGVTEMLYMFESAKAFNQPIGSWDTSAVRDMSRMFRDTAFNQPIGSWDVSAVTGMSQMFASAVAFNQPIGSWDVSAVRDMSRTFELTVVFNNGSEPGVATDPSTMSLWNTSDVTTMNAMFENAVAFNQNIGGWPVAQVRNSNNFSGNGCPIDGTTFSPFYVAPPPPPGPGTFSYTFNYIGAGGVVDASDPAKMPFLTTDGALVLNTVTCSPSGLLPDGTSVPVPVTVTVTFTFTDNGVTNDGLAFLSYDATPPQRASFFYKASTTGLTITQFGAIPLARSGSQFSELNDLTFAAPAGDAPAILLNTSLNNCFRFANNFNSDIANWNTSGVTVMASAFANARAFNQPIGSWDVSAVTEMYQMFANARAFNQPIGSWDVSGLDDMSYMFDGAVAFNNGSEPGVATDPSTMGLWNTSNVNRMTKMFSDAVAFNQNIGGWPVAQVSFSTNFSLGCPIDGTTFSPFYVAP